MQRMKTLQIAQLIVLLTPSSLQRTIKNKLEEDTRLAIYTKSLHQKKNHHELIQNSPLGNFHHQPLAMRHQ
jgi:hypothetical protein